MTNGACSAKVLHGGAALLPNARRFAKVLCSGAANVVGTPLPVSPMPRCKLVAEQAAIKRLTINI